MIESLRLKLRDEGWVTFRVKVRPQAQTSRFRGPLGDDTFKLDIAAPPEDGKANEELIRFLADAFDTSKSLVEIVGGHTGRLKTIVVRRRREF